MAPALNWCWSSFSPNEWWRFWIHSGCPESPLPFYDCRRLRWGGERAGGGEKCCALSFILAAHKGSKIKTQAGEKKKNPKFNWLGNRIPGASAFSASREGFRQGYFPALGIKKRLNSGLVWMYKLHAGHTVTLHIACAFREREKGEGRRAGYWRGGKN